MFKVLSSIRVTDNKWFNRLILTNEKLDLKEDIRTAWWTTKKLNVEQTYEIFNVGYSTMLSDSLGAQLEEFDGELPALIKKRASCAFKFDIYCVSEKQDDSMSGKTTYMDPEVKSDEFLMARYLEYMMPKF